MTQDELRRKCDKCNRQFPEHLIHPFWGSENIQQCCPICALKIRNEMHGLPKNTPFTGSQAQESYEEAVKIYAR